MYQEELVLNLQDILNEEDKVYFTIDLGNRVLNLTKPYIYRDGEIRFELEEEV